MKIKSAKGKNNINKFDGYVIKYYYDLIKKNKKSINLGKKYITRLNYLSLYSFIDDYYKSNYVFDCIISYVENAFNKIVKNSIFEECEFINKVFYFKYNNKYFKFKEVHGQGCMKAIFRVRYKDVNKNCLINIIGDKYVKIRRKRYNKRKYNK